MRHGDHLRFIDYAAIDLGGAHPELHGVEVKISRGDWLSERNKPEKAQAALGHVDRYYLLAGSRDVYRDEEVPDDWGILVLVDGCIEELRPARLLIPRASPATPWSRDIVTAIMRRVLAKGNPQQAAINHAVSEAERRGYQKGMNAAKRQQAAHSRGVQVRAKYDPGRYNFDDGIPLDLP